MEEENISVDSAEVNGDITAWIAAKYETDELSTRRVNIGQNTAQCLPFAGQKSGIAVNHIDWGLANTHNYDSSAGLRLLTDRLDQYARLSTNLIFRNLHGWNEPGYWVSDRLKELIAEYPDWEINVDDALITGAKGADVFMIVQDSEKKVKYVAMESAQNESIAITYILDMLVVKWHDREWSFTFEKQDKGSFLKDFERVLKIITSILNHVTKHRKEEANMKKSLDIIAEGAKYK